MSETACGFSVLPSCPVWNPLAPEWVRWFRDPATLLGSWEACRDCVWPPRCMCPQDGGCPLCPGSWRTEPRVFVFVLFRIKQKVSPLNSEHFQPRVKSWKTKSLQWYRLIFQTMLAGFLGRANGHRCPLTSRPRTSFSLVMYLIGNTFKVHLLLFVFPCRVLPAPLKKNKRVDFICYFVVFVFTKKAYSEPHHVLILSNVLFLVSQNTIPLCLHPPLPDL